MATTQEPESLVDLGREVAADASRLVKAEIAVAKAHALDALKKFALGIGLIFAGAVSSLFFIIFTIGTLVEGAQAIDSWPLYASLGGAFLGAGFLALGAGRARWLAVPMQILGALGLLTFVVGLVAFYVVAIIGGNDELGRRGWAIAATAFFVLTVVPIAIGGWVIWKGVKGGKTAVNDIKEDAAWVKQLTKRNASES